jgi:hypothetical protein
MPVISARFIGFSRLSGLFGPGEICPHGVVSTLHRASGINFFGPGEITNPKASHPVHLHYRASGINLFGLFGWNIENVYIFRDRKAMSRNLKKQ